MQNFPNNIVLTSLCTANMIPDVPSLVNVLPVDGPLQQGGLRINRTGQLGAKHSLWSEKALLIPAILTVLFSACPANTAPCRLG